MKSLVSSPPCDLEIVGTSSLDRLGEGFLFPRCSSLLLHIESVLLLCVVAVEGRTVETGGRGC